MSKQYSSLSQLEKETEINKLDHDERMNALLDMIYKQTNDTHCITKYLPFTKEQIQTAIKTDQDPSLLSIPMKEWNNACGITTIINRKYQTQEVYINWSNPIVHTIMDSLNIRAISASEIISLTKHAVWNSREEYETTAALTKEIEKLKNK